MIKKIVKYMILINILISIYFLSIGIYQRSMSKYYDCKVLKTYFENAGYKVSVKYVAVIHINEINKNTSIYLSPENYYDAQQYKVSNKTIQYKFNKSEINEIITDERDNISKFFLSLIPLTFICGFYIFIILINNYDTNNF